MAGSISVERPDVPQVAHRVIGDPIGALPATRWLVPVSNYVNVGGIWIPYDPSAIPIPGISALGYDVQDVGTLVDSARILLRQISDVGAREKLVARSTSSAPIATADGQDVPAIGTRQGHPWMHDLGTLAAAGYRMVVGVDAGAYVPPAAGGTQITFTGVNLLGLLSPKVWNETDQRWHTVTAVVDPAGGAAGTITLTPLVTSANAIFVLPYKALPHAYDPMTFAFRGLGVNQPQDHVNGPARLANLAANPIVVATYDYDSFVNPYVLISVQAKWALAAGNTGQLDFFARLDDDAAGTWTNVNGFFTVAGSALGAAVQNGQGLYVSTRPQRIREFRSRWVKVGANAGAETCAIWQTIGSAV